MAQALITPVVVERSGALWGERCFFIPQASGEPGALGQHEVFLQTWPNLPPALGWVALFPPLSS